MTAPPPSTDSALFESAVLPFSRPDHLALTSWFHGGPLPPPQPLRYLEIGSGNGGNLLPLAFYNPMGSFLGVTASAAEREAAEAGARLLGLTNLRFTTLAGDALLDPSGLGTFDFIFVRGDAISLAARDLPALLNCCEASLSESGLACVMYDVPAGSDLSERIGNLLTFLTRTLSDPLQRARQAQAFADKILALTPSETGHPYPALFSMEMGRVARGSLSDVHRDYLEKGHETIPFRDVHQALETLGLRYVADAMAGRPEERLPTELRSRVVASGLGALEVEETLDLLCCRRTRQSIVCRDAAPCPPPPGPRAVRALSVGTRLTPQSAEPRLEGGASVRFVGPDGASLETDEPLLKTALVLLAGRAPAGVQVADLLREAEGLILKRRVGYDPTKEARDGVSRAIMDLHRQGVVELRLREPERAGKGRPHPLAQYEARRGSRVTTPLQEVVGLDEMSRQVLAGLGEGDDRDTLAARIVDLVVTGDLVIERYGIPVTERDAVEPLVQQRLLTTLANFADWGLYTTSGPEGQNHDG